MAFQDFDVESTGEHEKEYERARRMQQDGHVIPSALKVTCGTVTNLGDIKGTLFAVDVVRRSECRHRACVVRGFGAAARCS